MTKIRSGPKPSSASQTQKAAAKKPAVKKAETKQASGAQFPRTAWKDSNKLEGAITRNREQIGLNQNEAHPRLQHSKPKVNPQKPSRPPVAMRYGLRPPDNNRPPVAMRYGLRPPVDNGGGGTGGTRPPVAMRYGLRPPVDNGGGSRPPVAARYGVVRPPPIDDGGGSNRPPIAMRYGLRRPGND